MDVRRACPEGRGNTKGRHLHRSRVSQQAFWGSTVGVRQGEGRSNTVFYHSILVVFLCHHDKLCYFSNFIYRPILSLLVVIISSH